jgi:opacity protein-like surface antigen
MVVMLAMVTIVPACAGPLDGVDIMVSSGVVIPASSMTFANCWKMQYGGGIGAGIPLSPSITLVGSFEYYRFTLNEDGIREGFDTKFMRDIWAFDDVTLNPSADPGSVMAISANVRIVPVRASGPLTPYFMVGIGAMRFSLGEIALPTTSQISLDSSAVSITAARRITGGTETAALIQGGLGLDMRLTGMLNVFIEARFVRGLTQGLGTAYVPLTAGVRLQL